jgi:hypothetical protein
MKSGVIFCSISDAVKEYPELIEEYMVALFLQVIIILPH